MAVAAQRKIIKSVSSQLLIIPSGTALSRAFKLEYDDLVGIYMPAAWDAADIGFQVSYDPSGTGTYYPVRDQANAVVTVTLTTATDIFVALPRHLVPGGLWVKIWSHAAGVSVNQTADRALVIVTQPIES